MRTGNKIIDGEIHLLAKWYKHWRYHNTILLIISLAVFFILLKGNFLDSSIAYAGNLGYIGAGLAGLFFVLTFTVAPAAALLFHFAQELNPIIVAIAASIGAAVGDYVIFRFVKEGISQEIRDIFTKLGGTYFTRLISTPYFGWLAPVIGAIFIASPLPNELGIGLMSIAKIKHWQFIMLSVALNSAGIFFVVLLASSL